MPLRDIDLALSVLHEMSQGRRTVPADRLQPLHIIRRDSPARGRYQFTGTTYRLDPGADVLTSQSCVRVPVLIQCLHELADVDSIPAGFVCCMEGCDVRHLDGLHRLVAARLLGMSVEASVWSC